MHLAIDWLTLRLKMRRGNSQKMAINWLMQKINESTLRFLIVRRSGIIALMQTSSSVDDMEDWSGGVWCRLLTSHQTDEKWKTENAETAQCDFLLVAQTVASLITVQHATFLLSWVDKMYYVKPYCIMTFSETH